MRGFGFVRLDEGGAVIDALERRPDGRFWSPDALAAGATGELAVVDDGAVAWYGAEHPSGALLELPRGFRHPRIAHGGRWIAIWEYGPRALLLDTRALAFFAVDLAEQVGATGETAVPFGFGAGGRELRALDVGRMLLLRYALPGG